MRALYFSVLILFGVFALSACAPMPQTIEESDTALPALVWPEGQLYLVDSQRSEFRVRLSAEGPLAAFGHPHVIGSQSIQGQVMVADPWTASAFQLQVAIDDFLVDPPRWRADAQLDPILPTDAIEATTANMRSPQQLNADRYPHIELQSMRLTGTRHQPMVEVWVWVAGRRSLQTLPVAVHWGEDELIISAATTWQLSALDIQPFSVFAGGLRVGDEIDLRLRLYARSGKDQSIGD